MYQGDFSGGLNMFKCPSALSDNEYVFGINLRSRDTNLAQIRKPLKETAPMGKKQGIYAIGSILIMFVSGKAYYKVVDSTDWIEIENFQLDENVDYIYGCAVPATSNIKRVATGADSRSVLLTLDQTSIPAPACFLCQDGINQPFKIFTDGTCVRTQTYAEWTVDNREYVPIGKQMAFIDGILYIVSPDGKTIYRSVTYRPLDFVVNVKPTTGDKGGDATTVSFAVDFNEITCIAATNSESFFVSTQNSCYLVTPDYTDTIFGEPQFAQIRVMATGAINHHSFIETAGDFAFIDREGIKTFNAVQQLKFKGRNGNFGIKFISIFDIPGTNKKFNQGINAAIRYNDYAVFAVNSIFGYILVIYDELLGVPVSFDITECIKVKQFAVAVSPSTSYLYAITDNNVYQYYGSTEFAESIVRTRDWVADMEHSSTAAGLERNINQQRSSNLKVLFDSTVTGMVYACEYVDGRLSEEQIGRDIIGIDYGIPAPTVIPAIFTKTDVHLTTFVFSRPRDGIKLGYTIRWVGGSNIEGYELKTNVNTADVSNLQKG